MKDGLSGSIVNEMQVNDIENEAKQQARLNLDRVKNLEKPYSLKQRISCETLSCVHF